MTAKKYQQSLKQITTRRTWQENVSIVEFIPDSIMRRIVPHGNQQEVNQMEMEAQIYNFIKSWRNVSFAELSRRIDGFEGKLQMCSADNVNIVYWGGISSEAFEAITKLKAEKKIFMNPTSAIVYLVDGAVPTLPVVKGRYKYLTPHWLPVVFNPSKTEMSH